mgnify:CR=1 FL=1
MSIINHKFDAETTPVYFSLALKRSYDVYIVYFLLFMVCIACFGYPLNALPVTVWLAVSLLARHFMNRIFIRWNFLFYVVISAGWISYFIYYYGWNCGGTNFILPLMLISMFSLYDTTFNKIAFYPANGPVFSLPESSTGIYSDEAAYVDPSDCKYDSVFRDHGYDLYDIQC